jgi:hypothetical protein
VVVVTQDLRLKVDARQKEEEERRVADDDE